MLRAGLARDRLGELRRDERLEEDRRRRASRRTELRRASASACALGSDSGSMPGDRDLVQAVARGEVAERRVARDELAARAVREAARGTRGRARRSRAASASPRGRPAEHRADPLDDPREQHRVEPDVRVGLARLVADAARSPSPQRRRRVVPRAPRPPPRPRAGSRARGRGRRRACWIARDVLRRQLDVVRLGAGRRQVRRP